jgi:hypothetical protein
MELAPIIKKRLRPLALDRNDLLIKRIVQKLEPSLELEAEKLLSDRLLKKAFDEILREMRSPKSPSLDEVLPTKTQE